jgi:hypothetical protein
VRLLDSRFPLFPPRAVALEPGRIQLSANVSPRVNLARFLNHCFTLGATAQLQKGSALAEPFFCIHPTMPLAHVGSFPTRCFQERQ